MDTGTPDIVLRALSDDWMLGVYADPNGTKTVFVVATVDYFQNAFAGMLQWESVMADDLKQYLYQNTPADIAATTPETFASSSAPMSDGYVPTNQPVVLRAISSTGSSKTRTCVNS